MLIWAVDPGVTVGFAKLQIRPRPHKIKFWADAVHPGELFAALEERNLFYRPDFIVMEEFRLYPWLASSQGFNTFPAIEVIGVIKYLAAKVDTEVFMQKATVMREGRAAANRHGVPMVQRKLGSGKGAYKGWDFDIPGPPHPRDALAHGFWWAFNNETSYLFEGDGS